MQFGAQQVFLDEMTKNKVSTRLPILGPLAPRCLNNDSSCTIRNHSGMSNSWLLNPSRSQRFVTYGTKKRREDLSDIMKREDQQDATIICLLLTSVSTCFGHHYAHLQETKGLVTAFGVLFWFCWMWVVTVVGALSCMM